MNKRARFVTIGLILLLAASLLPASVSHARGPQGRSATAGAPKDYSEIKGLSQPRYETMTESYEVEMDDGIMMYVEVVRPTKPGRYGTILELSPYHGTIADRIGSRILPGPKGPDGAP